MVASQTWRLCREGNRPPGLSRRPMASLEAFRVAEEIFGPTWRKSETLECMSELPCDASEAKLSECLKKTEVSSGCKTYCSKPCVLEELEREACEVLCMASANPEQQACLADIDGETCEGQEDCVQLVVIVE